MADDVDNLVLEQLRLIRGKLGAIEGRLDGMAEDIKGLKAGQNSQTGTTVALAGYIRVERPEQGIGSQP